MATTTTLDDSPFSINIKDPDTDEQFIGTFRAKKRLSFMDQLTRDKLRRELLGVTGNEAENRAFSIAAIVAELSVRLTDSPKWWTETNNGLNLYSEILLGAVFDGCMQIEKEYKEQQKKLADVAKNEIKEELQKETAIK